MMVVHADYNFLSKEDCNKLIEFYKKSDDIHRHEDTFLISLADIKNNFIESILKKIKNKSEKLLNKKLILHTRAIVLWPENSKMAMHRDFDSDEFSVIVYLNDDYEGGKTQFIIKDKIHSVIPSVGTGLFFSGPQIKHGVSKVEKKSRYTLAVWLKSA